MLGRYRFERAIVEASSAVNAGIDAPTEKSHEMVRGAAPLITRDVLGETAGAYVVEGHICDLTIQVG